MNFDDPLEHLRAGATLVATGSFDLDPARAREKLARYQLVDPHRYVLQFVQAAQLSGATTAEIRVDTDELEMEFDGRIPTAEDLAELYLHAFGRRGVDRLEALRHLALGIIASEAMQPAIVTVDGVGAQLVVRDGAESVVEMELGVRNRIFVRERLRLAHLWEFVRSFSSELAEVVALRDARYADLKLVVNGRRVSRGIVAPRDRRTVVDIDTPFETGWVRVSREADAALSLVQHGVVLEQLRLDIGPLAVEGVVATRRLATNLSQSAFVRNHAWDELQNLVLLPAAFESAEEYLERTLEGSNRGFASALIAAALGCRAAVDTMGESVPPGVDRVVMRLADEPVWRRLPTRSSSERWVSTRDLLDAIGTGAVALSTHELEVDVLRRPDGELVEHVLFEPRRGEALTPTLLARATGRAVQDWTDVLREQHLRRARQSGEDSLAFDGISTVWPRTLRRDDFRTVQRAETSELVVEIGWDSRAVGGSTLVVAMSARRQFDRQQRPCALLPGTTVLVVDLTESKEPATELLRRAAPLVGEACLSAIFAPDAPALLTRDWAQPILAALAEGTVADQICTAFGWAPIEVAGVPLAGGSWQRLRDLQDAAPGDPRRDGLGSAAQIPLFDLVGGGRTSLAALNDGEVRFVRAQSRRRALQIEWELDRVGRRPVLWLDPADVEIVAWALGNEQLIDVEETMRADAARLERQAAGLAEEPVLHGLFDGKRALAGPDVRGEVGLASVEGDGYVEISLLHRGRRITHRLLDLPQGQFRAIVESSALTPTRDLGDIVEDDAYTALCERITTICHEMFEQWCLGIVERGDQTEVESLALWTAVASPDDPQRADWAIFLTTDGRRVSLRELREQVDDSLEVLEGRAPANGFGIRIPVAPGGRIALLRAMLPGIRLERRTASPSVSPRDAATDVLDPASDPAPAAITSEAPPTDGPWADLLAFLKAVGVPLDSVLPVDGGSPPKVRESTLTLGRDHALTQALTAHPSPRLFATLAIVAAAAADVLADVAPRLIAARRTV